MVCSACSGEDSIVAARRAGQFSSSKRDAAAHLINNVCTPPASRPTREARTCADTRFEGTVLDTNQRLPDKSAARLMLVTAIRARTIGCYDKGLGGRLRDQRADDEKGHHRAGRQQTPPLGVPGTDFRPDRRPAGDGSAIRAGGGGGPRAQAAEVTGAGADSAP